MRSAQIENFFALVQCKSFSKAAEYCFITRTALSKNISALETELGVMLFHRTSRGVELTDAGEIMYDFFNRSSLEFDDALKEAKDISNSSQLIRIALMSGINDGVFWDFLYKVHGNFPLEELNFRFSEGGDRNIANALIDGKIDCAVTFLSVNTFSEIGDERIQTVQIKNACHHLYYSALHPETWGNREPVPGDFKNSVFFILDGISQMHTPNGVVKATDYFSEQLGFPIRYEVCEGIQTIYHNVIIDQGVAILLDCIYSDWCERIRSIPLDLSIDPSGLVFAWRKDCKNEALLRLTRAFQVN